MSPFDPGDTEINRVIDKYRGQLFGSERLFIHMEATHPDFVMPVSKTEIREVISSLPADYTAGLAGVVVLRGSRKQEKVFFNRFSYGRYDGGAIFLHPYPKKAMTRLYKTLPKPSVLNEYKRAGATITEESGRCSISFDEGALRQFYLRDVLLHEVGHHVDSENLGSKSDKKAEGFAEWFASEYGFRLRGEN